MKDVINVLQMAVSLGLIGLILLQAKGVGLGRAWGGGGDFYKSRRGVEQLVFRLTAVFAFFFLVISILSVVTSS